MVEPENDLFWQRMTDQLGDGPEPSLDELEAQLAAVEGEPLAQAHIDAIVADVTGAPRKRHALRLGAVVVGAVLLAAAP